MTNGVLTTWTTPSASVSPRLPSSPSSSESSTTLFSSTSSILGGSKRNEGLGDDLRIVFMVSRSGVWESRRKSDRSPDGVSAGVGMRWPEGRGGVETALRGGVLIVCICGVPDVAIQIDAPGGEGGSGGRLSIESRLGAGLGVRRRRRRSMSGEAPSGGGVSGGIGVD